MNERIDQEKRMLGQVELAIHGSPKNSKMTQALMAMVVRSERLTGTLFIAYPLRTDAVLVSEEGQVTVIDLCHSVTQAG